MRLSLYIQLNFSSFSQADISGDIKPTVQKVENYLNSIEEVGFSGTVLLELNGSVFSSKGYGFGNIDKNIKNTPGTIFDIGSITKQFTAAAILKLEMQGKLSTNDKISRYFRNVPKDKLEITIHDLLRHQSGLQSNVGGDYDKITKPAFIDSVMHSQLKFEPALRFSYSNIGYSLLAIIVENVSGLSYEQYLYENLWKSLCDMARVCVENKVTTLSMPVIACGLDRLEWKYVKDLIEKAFLGTKVAITIYVFKK